MDQSFVPIKDDAALEQVIVQSHDGPVVLFKHDPMCSISKVAYQQVTKLGGQIPLIDVARDRDLSLGIASSTGIKHESPQVILFHRGRAVWSASHYDITTMEIKRAIQSYSEEQTTS